MTFALNVIDACMGNKRKNPSTAKLTCASSQYLAFLALAPDLNAMSFQDIKSYLLGNPKDDFTKHVARFHSLQGLANPFEVNFGIYNWLNKAARHFLHGVFHIFH